MERRWLAHCANAAALAAMLSAVLPFIGRWEASGVIEHAVAGVTALVMVYLTTCVACALLGVGAGGTADEQQRMNIATVHLGTVAAIAMAWLAWRQTSPNTWLRWYPIAATAIVVATQLRSALRGRVSFRRF